jgi:hypothetical protein
MKTLVLFVLLAIFTGGIIFAQTGSEMITVNGTLELNDGMILLKSGNATYLTRGLERLVGFIDGLKEGSQVTIEGYTSGPLDGETANFDRKLRPVKLTHNGKTYEAGFAAIANQGRLNHPGMGRAVSPWWGW